MSDFVLYFILASFFALGVVLIAMYSKTRWSYLAMILLTATSLMSSLGAASLRGQPKPVSTEIRNVEVAQVLWYKVDPGKHIYLVLTWRGLDIPLYYDMAWSKDLEQDLGQAQSKAVARGMPLMLKNPFGTKKDHHPGGASEGGSSTHQGNGSGSSSEDDGEDSFYAPPSPPLPPKDNMGDLLDGGT